jgi:hypothetical protein
VPTDPSNAVEVAKAHEGCFRDGFIDFIKDNVHVFKVFCTLTDQLWTRGRRYYSSRTIGEKMRFDHDVTTIGSDFKLNNNHTPDLGRLYVLMNMDRVSMFQFRRGGEFPKYIESLRELV